MPLGWADMEYWPPSLLTRAGSSPQSFGQGSTDCWEYSSSPPKLTVHRATACVERSNGQLKAALRARLAGTEWPDQLPWVLLGLRTALKEDSAISSAKLMFGTTLYLPAELIQNAEPHA